MFNSHSGPSNWFLQSSGVQLQEESANWTNCSFSKTYIDLRKNSYEHKVKSLKCQGQYLEREIGHNPGERPAGWLLGMEFWGLSEKLLFYFNDLVDTLLVASAGKHRFQPNLHDFFADLTPHYPASKRQNIGVIMFPSVPSYKFIVAASCAYTRYLVRHDARSNPSSINHYTTPCFALGDRNGNRIRKIRVVAWIFRSSSQVHNLVPKTLGIVFLGFFVLETAMVTAKCDDLGAYFRLAG